MKFFLCLIFLSTVVFAETKLLLVGGGARPIEAMKEFVKEAGAEKADILVIPWASESSEGADNIKKELLDHTKGSVESVPLRLTSLDLEKLSKRIEQCSGIFFSGGDQNTLMSLLKEYKLVPLLKKRFQEGVIFGGTSAGTAVMSNPMLTGNGDLSVLNGSQIELAEGLGLLPSSIIVDQHFIVRSRFNRLAGLVLKHKTLGIGVDEGTSLLVKDNLAKVIGPSQVLIFKNTGTNKLEVTVLSPHQTFTF